MSTAKKNMRLFRQQLKMHYDRIYKQIATKLFIWEGVPETIPVDYIEKMLYDAGSIMFGYADETGFFAQPYAASGEVDMYDRFTGYRVVSHTGLNGRYFPAEDVSIIKNNISANATKQIIKKYVDELIEIDITRFSNQTWQRIPVIFTGDQEKIQSIISLIQNTTSGNTPITVVDKNHGMGFLEVEQIKTQYLGAELRDEYKKVIGDLLTTLGINNLEVSKKERLVAAEAEINQEEVGINLLAYLEPRLDIAKEINEKFGLNVSVRVNEKLSENQDLDFGGDEDVDFET